MALALTIICSVALTCLLLVLLVLMIAWVLGVQGQNATLQGANYPCREKSHRWNLCGWLSAALNHWVQSIHGAQPLLHSFCVLIYSFICLLLPSLLCEAAIAVDDEYESKERSSRQSRKICMSCQKSRT